MKTILFLNASADLYGSDRSLLRTLEQLDKQCFRAMVVLPNQGPLVKEIEAMGIPVLVYNMGVIRKKYFNPLGLLYLSFHFLKSFFYLKKLAVGEGVHLIYANTSTVTVGALVAARLGISYITHLRETIQGPLVYKRWLGAYMGKLSTKMIAVSEATRKAWINFVGGQAIDVINNGILPLTVKPVPLKKQLELPPEALVIGTIARIHPQKGIDYLLRIAKELVERDPNIYFVLVGDHAEGYEKYVDQVHAYVEDKGLSNHVFFLGFKNQPLGYLKAFDVFILPSITPDSFPTVILEAFSQKIPVVATQQGGALEMITHESNGLLVPVGDYLAAAQLIYPLLTAEVKRREMGLRGYQKFKEHYTLEVFGKKINAYLQTL